MAKVNTGQVTRAFRKLIADASVKQPRVEVGYSQAYAVYVHENLQAHHPVGRAKFLEIPARKRRPEMVKIVSALLKKGKSPKQALLAAGLYLQSESQALCPVDTGALRNSAFTKVT